MRHFQPSIADLKRRGIPFSIREHRIATPRDARSDAHAEAVKNKLSKTAAEARKAEWRKMFWSDGMSVAEIAFEFDVAETTVRRVTGGRYRHENRKTQKINVNGEVYESQVDAKKKLHISRDTLIRWIKEGKAHYIK